MDLFRKWGQSEQTQEFSHNNEPSNAQMATFPQEAKAVHRGCLQQALA